MTGRLGFLLAHRPGFVAPPLAARKLATLDQLSCGRLAVHIIAVAVFGGFAPFIATWLIGVTGSNLAPSYYLIAAATITFLVVLRIPETAFEPLR